MTWFKSDDMMPSHPKVTAIPRKDRCAVMGLWSMAGMWCAGHLTDGFVPDYMVDELTGTPKLAETLVRVGLWEAVDGGYQMHDYLEYNPSAEEVRADQRRKHEAKAKAGRAGGIASGVARRKHAGSSDEAESKQNEAETNRNEAPSRPDPLEEKTSSSRASDESDEPDLFDEFWKLYPRKDAKQDAIKAWKQITKTEDPAMIVKAVAVWPFKETRSYNPMPATWLRGKRWEDEVTTLPLGGGETLTRQEIDNLIGPWIGSTPQPPADVVDTRAWHREQAEQRNAERLRLALAKKAGLQ